MSVVNEKWTEASFSDLASFVIGGDWGKDPESELDDDFVEVKCIRGSEIKFWDEKKGSTAVLRKVKSASLEKRKLQKGDILLEISGGGPDQPVGRTVLIDEESLLIEPNLEKVCTNFLRLVRPTSLVDSGFLKHYLSLFYLSGEIVKYQGGSNNLRNLKYKEFETIKIPLPPLGEQKRMVAKLDSLFGDLEELKGSLGRIPELLKNFRQAVLTQAVTGKLTQQWRVGKDLGDVDEELELIYKDRDRVVEEVRNDYKTKGLKVPRKPDVSILEGSHLSLNIPTNWKEVRVGDLIVDLTDYHANGSYVILKENVVLKEEEDFACMIRSTNFEKDNFDDLLIYINEHAYNFLRKSKLFGGEILISKIGNAGSVYLMPNLGRPASLAMNLFALRISNLVNNKYLYYYLSSYGASLNIDKYVRGVATKSIDKISVRSLMVGLPSKEEQVEIVRRVEGLFENISAIEERYEQLKQKINDLPQAILAKAFRGELVPQLPIDGDAKDLLEEIKALKESLKVVKKGKKK